MEIEKVGAVFHDYCLSNKILKIMLPLGIPMIMIGALLKGVDHFINLGSGINVIAYVAVILGILLTFAKSEYKMMSIGIGIYVLGFLYNTVVFLIKYQSISWTSILYALIWGFFSYMAYKKSLRINQ